MKEKRESLGGSHGYTVEKVVLTDENGEELDITFEVRDSSGTLDDTFTTLQAALSYIETRRAPAPPGGLRMV